MESGDYCLSPNFLYVYVYVYVYEKLRKTENADSVSSGRRPNTALSWKLEDEWSSY